MFSFENRKSKHHHWILHNRIILDTNFQLKLTILNFGPNLPKKGICGQKQKKENIAIEFYILQLV